MICDSVQAGFFTLMADESKDCSKIEQFFIVFRYADVDTGIIYERFLTYVHATSCTADSLTSYIKKFLDMYQIDPGKMVCQCYEGASVMSGCKSGVQRQVQNLHPAHCRVTAMPTVLIWHWLTVSNQCLWGGSFLQAYYMFISTPKSHSVFLKM